MFCTSQLFAICFFVDAFDMGVVRSEGSNSDFGCARWLLLGIVLWIVALVVLAIALTAILVVCLFRQPEEEFTWMWSSMVWLAGGEGGHMICCTQHR